MVRLQPWKLHSTLVASTWEGKSALWLCRTPKSMGILQVESNLAFDGLLTGGTTNEWMSECIIKYKDTKNIHNKDTPCSRVTSKAWRLGYCQLPVQIFRLVFGQSWDPSQTEKYSWHGTWSIQKHCNPKTIAGGVSPHMLWRLGRLPWIQW
jgi:hypothetical protein